MYLTKKINDKIKMNFLCSLTSPQFQNKNFIQLYYLELHEDFLTAFIIAFFNKVKFFKKNHRNDEFVWLKKFALGRELIFFFFNKNISKSIFFYDL